MTFGLSFICCIYNDIVSFGFVSLLFFTFLFFFFRFVVCCVFICPRTASFALGEAERAIDMICCLLVCLVVWLFVFCFCLCFCVFGSFVCFSLLSFQLVQAVCGCACLFFVPGDVSS